MKIEVNVFVSWALKLAIFVIAMGAFFYKEYLFGIYSLVFLAISLLPAILSRNYNITLPWFFDLIIIIPIFLDILGIATRFYEKIWYYDYITHFLGTATISIISFTLVYTLHYIKVIKISVPWLVFFTIMFSLAIGTLWEIIEFAIDLAVKTPIMQDDGARGTMLDILFDLLGGTIAAILGAIYFIKIPKREVKHIVSPFIELMGQKPEKEINISLRRKSRK